MDPDFRRDDNAYGCFMMFLALLVLVLKFVLLLLENYALLLVLRL